MNTLKKYRKEMMSAVISGNDKAKHVRNLNIMLSRSSVLKNNFIGIVALLIVGLFSNLAHSADSDVCTPSNGVPPRINIYFDVTVIPTPGSLANTYTDSQPAAAAGPITCSYAHDRNTVYALNNAGIPSNQANVPFIDIGSGFTIGLQVSTTPGYVIGGISRWAVPGSSPDIPATVYPAVRIAAPNVSEGSRDITITSQPIGYVATTGGKLDSNFSASNFENMTAVYASGVIRFPPKCTYDPEISLVTMPTHFASDFSAVSAGTPLDTPIRVAGKVTCIGGNTSFDGSDLVHISLIPGTQGDGNYIAGIQNVPEVGIRVLDNAGNPLLVNGTEAIAMQTNPNEISPDQFNGTFDFPLQFQLVSRTGTAPTKFGDYRTTLVISMRVD